MFTTTSKSVNALFKSKLQFPFLEVQYSHIYSMVFGTIHLVQYLVLQTGYFFKGQKPKRLK